MEDYATTTGTRYSALFQLVSGRLNSRQLQNLCFEKSQKTNVRSARLPIGTYLSELKTRKVLTVNQTFEILLKWVEMRDWKEALYTVIPKRKFQNPSSEGSVSKGDQDGGDHRVQVVSADTLDDSGCTEDVIDEQASLPKVVLEPDSLKDVEPILHQ